MKHREHHRTQHVGWLRAAVLGANDGIVSTASLIVGVAAAQATHDGIVVAGVAGLVAGAMSMAAGEYVSVSSQSDTERADLQRERRELATNSAYEHRELTQIYIDRGLEPDLAGRVARQLMEKDALAAHARDELGISEVATARPVQAALTSAVSFAIGAGLPLLAAALASLPRVIPSVIISSLVLLACLGALAAHTGGASKLIGSARVTFWGTLAMGVTAGVGSMFDTAV